MTLAAGITELDNVLQDLSQALLQTFLQPLLAPFLDCLVLQQIFVALESLIEQDIHFFLRINVEFTELEPQSRLQPAQQAFTGRLQVWRLYPLGKQPQRCTHLGVAL